jgi:hypothetical protein
MLALTWEALMAMENLVSGCVRGSIEPEGCGDLRANYPASDACGVFGTDRGSSSVPRSIDATTPSARRCPTKSCARSGSRGAASMAIGTTRFVRANMRDHPTCSYAGPYNQSGTDAAELSCSSTRACSFNAATTRWGGRTRTFQGLPFPCPRLERG